MTKLRSLPYAVLTFSMLAAGSASAQSMESIATREANQQQRIVNGIGDGSLTRGETYRLEQGEQRIDNYEARARADGHVSGYERQRLDGMLDRESHEIHQQRTDGQRAGGWNGGGWNGDGWHRGSINAREAQQQQRIVNGVRDGSLTRGETYRLEQGERRIDSYEARARADGHVSGYERQRLDGMLDRESHEIHQQRNDGQRAGGWNGGGWNGGSWQNGGHAAGGWNGGSNQGGWNQGGWGGHTPGTPPATGGTAAWQGGSHAQPQAQMARPMTISASAQQPAQPRAAFNGSGGGRHR